MKTIGLFGALAAASLIAQPASAQSYRDLQHGQPAEVRVSAGITIPFGGKKRAADSKPRFDLGFDQHVRRRDVLLAVNPARANAGPEWRRTSLSLTFEENPRMMLNGAQVARFNLTTNADESDAADESKDGGGGGGNTALIVGGVLVGGLLVATVAATADFVDAIDDITDPD